MREVKLACGTVYTLQQLEDAKLSYVPCGVVDGEEKPLLTFAHLWKNRQRVTRKTYAKKWNAYTLRSMTGVQIMTGFPSYRHTDRTGIYLYYTSFDIECRMIETFPSEVEQIERLYLENVIGSPCRIETKSDGLRLDAYTEYFGKKMSFKDDGGMLFEVLADKCLVRIDNRYRMLEGSLLDLPTLPKETLQEIYHIAASVATVEQSNEKPREVVETSQLGDLAIEWGSNGRSQLFPTQHCQRTSHRSNRDEVRFTKHADGSVDGKCFNCGESWWEIEPKERTPRYQTDTAYTHETSTLEVEQEANKNVLVKWLQDTEHKTGRHLLILGSAAGTGKTTVATTTADNLLYIAKTTEEADQVFKNLFEAEDDVVRHRSRLYNRDREDWNTLPLGLTENDRPCIKPELCNLYAKRGHPTHEVCNRCPLVSECKTNGYLSQAKREKNALKVVYSWGEIVACDWIYRDRVKRICSKDDILIVDEVNPAELTQHRRVTRDMLFDLTERFRDGNTPQEFETLKALLDLISTAEDDKAFMDGLKAQIDAIEDIKALDDKLQNYPVGHVFSDAPADADYAFQVTMHYCGKEVTVPVVSHETGLDTPVLEVSAEKQITTDKWQLAFFPVSVLLKVGLVEHSDPPRRFRSFIADIKTFLEEHPNLETAPYTFDPKEQTFDFHLKPTLNHRRVIFNTASDPDNLISEAYRDANIQITRHTGTPPKWKSPLAFQLATGNYLPRHSQLTTVEGVLQLKPRAQEMVDQFIVPSIEAGLKTLIVAPKAFQKVEGVKKWAATKLKDFQIGRNALLINHHHAEGRNDFLDFDIVFVFHYEPNHHEIQAEAKRIYRNPETPLDFTREKRTVTVGGVSFEKMIYIDARVQAVYNRECRERLMQSAMRLRPNIHDGKIIVFLTAEPVDIPVTPVAFSLSDAEGFTGDWQAFREKLQAGDTRTAKERMETGESKSKAYRDTEPSRKQTKAEMKQLASKWHSEGLDFTEIASRLSEGQPKPIHRTTVARWIKDAKF